MEKFVLKEALTKVDWEWKLLKMSPQDVNIQKPTDHTNICSAAKLYIAEYKKKTSYKENKVLDFRKEVLALLATLILHTLWRSLP